MWRLGGFPRLYRKVCTSSTLIARRKNFTPVLRIGKQMIISKTIIIIYSFLSAVTVIFQENTTHMLIQHRICHIQLDNGKVSQKPKIKWFEDENGRFKGSSDCSFPSESVLLDNVDKIKVNLFTTCPKSCYKDNRCTHFIYTNSYCYLKECKTVDASLEAVV